MKRKNTEENTVKKDKQTTKRIHVSDTVFHIIQVHSQTGPHWNLRETDLWVLIFN